MVPSSQGLGERPWRAQLSARLGVLPTLTRCQAEPGGGLGAPAGVLRLQITCWAATVCESPGVPCGQAAGERRFQGGWAGCPGWRPIKSKGFVRRDDSGGQRQEEERTLAVGRRTRVSPRPDRKRARPEESGCGGGAERGLEASVFPEVGDPRECAGEVTFVGSLSRLARGNKRTGSSVRPNGDQQVLCVG